MSLRPPTRATRNLALIFKNRSSVPALLPHSYAMVSRMMPISRTLLPTRLPPKNSHASSKACRRRQTSQSPSKVHYHPSSEIGHGTSKSVHDLISAHVTCEVKLRLANLRSKLENCDGSQDGNLSYELERYLFPPGLKSSVATRITKAAQKKMESVSSGNIAAEAKKAAESAITEEFQKGINKQLLGLMQ